jgi:hypothetical protein
LKRPPYNENGKIEIMTPDLKNVIPIDWYELILELDNFEIKSFEPSKANLYKEYNFLAYPNRLRGYSFNKEKITWYNGIAFDKEFLYNHSQNIDSEKLKWKYVSISRKNQAPTDKHKTHHVYDISIKPFDEEKYIVLSESVGGGHGEMGDSSYYSIEELLKLSDWQSFFIMSDCGWGIDIIENSADNKEKIIKELIHGMLDRNKSNN